MKMANEIQEMENPTKNSTASNPVRGETEDEEEIEKMELKAVEEEEMKPWDQHSAVISIPRFDYDAPSSLLRHSHSGFLITCPIKREKSATKEAISILEKHIMGSVDNENLGIKMSAKRRKICEGIEGDVNSFESKGVVDECWKSAPADSVTNTRMAGRLSLVKLTRSGLLLFTFPRNRDQAVVDIVSNVIQSLDTGSLKPPQWCHRIFPIQATCSLNEEEVQTVVSKLVNQFLDDNRTKVSRPVKFAVGFNRRGIEETVMKDKKITSNDSSDVCSLFDRNKCFTVVAAAVKEAVPDSVVDLKCPELAVLLEVLPLSGISSKQVVVAVSILPQILVSTKPRLCVKALVSDAKSGNRQKDS